MNKANWMVTFLVPGRGTSDTLRSIGVEANSASEAEQKAWSLAYARESHGYPHMAEGGIGHWRIKKIEKLAQ